MQNTITKLPVEEPSTEGSQLMMDLARRLYPLHRGITGVGVRQTLSILREQIPLRIMDVASGTPIFDWTLPEEWQIRDAFIRDDSGERIVDYRRSNLHILNHSQPYRGRLKWRELKPHIHSLPQHPTWIPYRTAFFRDDWGFCLPHQLVVQLDQQPDREFDVCIDAEFRDGALTYGEVCLPGTTEDEVLISTHVCHPSLANDNLSGIVVATALAAALGKRDLRYTYRFIFVPAMIGAITWLGQNRRRLDRIKHGLVLTGVGDGGGLTYKRSRRGHAEIDRAFAHVLQHGDRQYELREFTPVGYDERQFCSPGFNLPVGCLMRTPHAEYAEYHTSADNLDFIQPHSLVHTWRTCLQVVDVLETNRAWLNTCPYGEPQLGRRGLYRAFGQDNPNPRLQQAVLWVLNLSDGEHTLLDIAERSGLDFPSIAEAATILRNHDLLVSPQPDAVDMDQRRMPPLPTSGLVEMHLTEESAR